MTGHEGAYNVALAKVIDDKGVFEKRFIFYLLKTQIFQTPLAMLSRSAQNGFSKGEIARIELPIPPTPRTTSHCSQNRRTTQRFRKRQTTTANRTTAIKSLSPKFVEMGI